MTITKDRLCAYVLVAGWLGSESSAQWSSLLEGRWGWFAFDTLAMTALVVVLVFMVRRDSRR